VNNKYPMLKRALLLLVLVSIPAVALATKLPSLEQNPTPGDSREHFEIAMTTMGFEPLELVIPTNEKIEIVIKNNIQAPIEFDCPEIKYTKIIQPSRTISIFLENVKPGTYRYVDAFNGEYKGFITAK